MVPGPDRGHQKESVIKSCVLRKLLDDLINTQDLSCFILTRLENEVKNMHDLVKSAAGAVGVITTFDSARATFKHYYGVARWQSKQINEYAEGFCQSKLTKRSLAK